MGQDLLQGGPEAIDPFRHIGLRNCCSTKSVEPHFDGRETLL
jgi:hypothetical protein